MFILILFSKWLVKNLFEIPEELTDKAVLVFRIAGIGFLGSLGMSWGRALSMGIQRFDITYSVSTVISIIGSFIGLFVVYKGLGVVGYVIARTGSMLLGGPVYFLITRTFIPEFRFVTGMDKTTLRRIRSYIGYGTFNRILSSLVCRLDQMLIGIWVGVAASGVYAIPFLVTSSIGYMLAYMLGFVFPMASELYTTNQTEKLKDIFQRSSRFMFAVSGWIFATLFVLGEHFFKLWTPSIFNQVKDVLPLLCISFFINTITASLANNIMVGIGRIRDFSFYTTARAFVQAGSCFFLIKSMGIIGAGWSLLITCVVDIAWFFYVISRYLKFHSIKDFLIYSYLKPFMLSIIIVIIGYVLKQFADTWIGLVFVVTIISILFVFMGFLIGVFGDTEKRAIKEIVPQFSRFL
jgi:O-antigen/teichoic acid export membrane protein